MIGNDIIDLALTRQESRWYRPGFLNKLFTDSEQEVIRKVKYSELIVWLFWSIKESTYKIISRNEQHQFFAPKKFSCTLLDYPDCLNTPSISGFGHYKKSKFYTTSVISNDLIHTTAQTENTQSIQQMFFKLPGYDCKTQSAFTRQQLKEHYAVSNNLNMPDLEIRKTDAGVPFLFYKNEKLTSVISLSHHGRFGGFSYSTSDE